MNWTKDEDNKGQTYDRQKHLFIWENQIDSCGE